MKRKKEKDPIIRMFAAVEAYKHRLQKCEESNPMYWSGGDPWCSGDDISSAINWKNDKVSAFVKKYLRRAGWKAPCKE